MAFSLWGGYINKCHLDDILILVNEAHNNSLNAVLEFPPPVTMQDNMWLFGSGIHLVSFPISEDEKNEFNKSFSYYYGIKGIKIRKN